MRRSGRVLVMPLGILAAFPAVSQPAELAMLDGLARGGWELRNRADGAVHRLCLRTGREPIQLRHAQQGCETFIIRDEPTRVTVQYSCRGAGYGRTTIRSEGRQLVQIRSQGIHVGEPFLIEGEARHVGRC